MFVLTMIKETTGVTLQLRETITVLASLPKVTLVDIMVSTTVPSAVALVLNLDCTVLMVVALVQLTELLIVMQIATSTDVLTNAVFKRCVSYF